VTAFRATCSLGRGLGAGVGGLTAAMLSATPCDDVWPPPARLLLLLLLLPSAGPDAVAADEGRCSCR
jgi:hypothetical protein